MMIRSIGAFAVLVLVVLAISAEARADRRDYILIVDRKAEGIGGGECSPAQSWLARDLNSIEHDGTMGEVTLSASRFTLPAGTYEATIRAPAAYVGRHRARLQNLTEGATELLGSSEWAQYFSGSNFSAQTHSVIQGHFTIQSSSEFEVQHWCRFSDGAGSIPLIELGFFTSTNHALPDDEIYTTVQLYRAVRPNPVAGLTTWGLVLLAAVLWGANRIRRGLPISSPM